MKKDQDWQVEPATQLQIEFMKKLFVQIEPEMTKLDAKKAIDSAIVQKRKRNFRNERKRKVGGVEVPIGRV